MQLVRTSVLLFLLSLAAPLPAAGLTYADDLARDAEQARAQSRAIMVFFTADFCPYCHEVEELYLRPMVERGTYAQRLLIRVVNVTSAKSVRDFEGRRTDHGAFASRERAGFTPVIRFYDGKGRELVPALVGYSSADFYAGELEDAIEEAIRRARLQDAPKARAPL